MDSIILQGFRSFRGSQAIPIRPLTILVGENSSGKSSFLAAVRTATNIFRRSDDIDFNEAPFSLGAYEQIASYSGGRGGRARSFQIGYSLNATEVAIEVIATFTQVRTQPVVTSISVSQGDYSAELKVTPHPAVPHVILKGPGAAITFEPKEKKISARRFWDEMFFFLDSSPGMFGKFSNEQGHWKPEFNRRISRMLHRARMGSHLKAYCMAPIRTKPDRNYDPKKDKPQPEGEHIPMLLARIAAENPELWNELRGSLRRFGVDSGLFQDIMIRRLGNYESDPFQIRVKVSGPDDNIVDVGYGVSQVLPVIVDMLTMEGRITSLLQQPEVHLHPRAQAALGSFIAKLVEPNKREFIIETHSDYFIDRIQLDIRDKKLKLSPDDVLILFFDHNGRWTQVHPITFDSRGNVVGAPQSYRRFFLEEDQRHFRFD